MVKSAICIVWQFFNATTKNVCKWLPQPSSALLVQFSGVMCILSKKGPRGMLGRGACTLLVSSHRLNYLNTWFKQSKQRSLVMIGLGPQGPLNQLSFGGVQR